MYIITFRNMSDEITANSAIKAFCTLNNKVCQYNVVPVPRQISTTCGVAYSFEFESLGILATVINNLISSSSIDLNDVHLYEFIGEDKYNTLPLK